MAVVTTGTSQLPERPPISAPDRPRDPSRQPALGAKGLLLVVPIAAALAVGAGGAQRSVDVLGPLVLYALPLVAMVAFWWEDWPGTRLPSRWSGWVDTVLIAAGASVLAAVGDAVFPTVTPAAAAFVAMLQLTLVGEGWPLRRLPRLPAGLLAVAIAWAVALIVYFAFEGRALASVLIAIGAWQALFYVAWAGWPFSAIASRARRLTCAHAVVVAAGVGTTLLVHDVAGVGRGPLEACAACFVAAALLFGMLFEGWLGRAATVAASVAVAAALAVTLRVVLGGSYEWVTHVGLNALGVSVILHVAIGRRWPFGA